MRQEIGLNTLARLVVRPQFIAERFDDMISCDTNVRRAAFDHPQHRGKDPSHGGDFAALVIPRVWECVIMPE